MGRKLSYLLKIQRDFATIVLTLSPAFLGRKVKKCWSGLNHALLLLFLPSSDLGVLSFFHWAAFSYGWDEIDL